MTDERLDGRILLLAPTARDAATSRGILEAAGVPCGICASIEEVLREVERGAGAALVTAEAVLGDKAGRVADWLAAQPPWSDFPLIILTPPGAESPKFLEALAAIGHMTLMKRPVQMSALVSAARAALRDRERQYVVRDLLAERQQTAEALRAERERYRVTLSSIGDAVIATDIEGRVTFVNRVAEELTRWDAEAARGRPLEEVFRIVNESSRQPVENPARRALDDGKVVGLANHTVLIARDGSEYPLDDSAAPIRDESGAVAGAVLVFREISARKAAEEQMRRAAEANAKFRTMFEQGAQFAGLLTLEGVVVEANRLSLDACGFARDDVLGKPFWECGWWNRSESLVTFVQRACTQAAEVGTFRAETKYFVADGTERFVDLTIAPVTDDAGRTLFFTATGTDVTERRRVEEELRDIRSRMEAALAAGAIGTWMWEVPTDRFFADPSLARMFLLSPDVAAGGPLARIVESLHPDDRERVAGLVNKAVESGDRFEADYRVAQADGSWRWITARGQVERDAHGRATRFPGVVIDITDRKHAETAVARLTAESEQQRRLYEAVLSGTPDFVYVFSLDHRVLYANDALIEMWGRGRDGAIGKTFLEIGYEPWHAEMHGREIDQVRTTKKPIRGEVPFTGTSGRRIYDYIFVPVFGAGGEVEAVAGTTRDVTDRQAMEHALREADRKKDEFIALLAHELRNPLAPIRNGLQVIRLARGDAGAVDRARDMMDRQLSHMVRLIDDLLDVSRISRNKMELRRSRVLLTDVVSSAVETARPLIEAEGHELHISLPQQPIFLDADVTRLAQVFSNLLTNSAKYTGRGGQLWLTAVRQGGEVVVTVRDTGIGIPLESLGKIFEMFSQVDRPTERNTGGLGIGLALVKGLVEMHGGTVTAASEGEGKGSTFTVKLPVMADKPETTVVPATDNGQVVPGQRILVVDDNRDGADSLAMMLGLMGNEVRTANDGLRAVEQAEAFRPEVILMDVGMPRLNGLDATRRIRGQAWGKAMTIIALTGWGQEGDKERSREAGCDGHLVKPVSLPDLGKLLAELRGA